MPENQDEMKCEPYLVEENDIGLPKAHVEHCSNQSIFDQVNKKHDPQDNLKDIDLNHIDNILYVQDNLLIDNDDMNKEEAIKHSKKILAKNTEFGHCLFVPKEIIYEYAAMSLSRDLDF